MCPKGYGCRSDEDRWWARLIHSRHRASLSRAVRRAGCAGLRHRIGLGRYGRGSDIQVLHVSRTRDATSARRECPWRSRHFGPLTLVPQRSLRLHRPSWQPRLQSFAPRKRRSAQSDSNVDRHMPCTACWSPLRRRATGLLRQVMCHQSHR